MTTKNLELAISYVKTGNKESAKKLLTDYVQLNPDSEPAWLWLSACVELPEQKRYCLEKALHITPNNQNVRKALEELQPQSLPSYLTESTIGTREKERILSNREQKQPIITENQIGGYVKSTLLPNENVLAIAKLHWAIFIPPILLSFVAICMTLPSIFPVITYTNQSTSSPDLQKYNLFSFALCSLPWWIIAIMIFIRSLLQYMTTEFALTDQRIIGKTGIIWRKSLEMVLSKVESISINQGIIGRILGYGSVIVRGSGGTHQGFPAISDPMKMKQKINSSLPR